MATPMTPPPPVIVPTRRKRSLAGPVILIVVGVVFLLGTMGMLTWKSLFLWYAHYWPVLLILGGVIKLVEHFIAQRDNAQAPGIGAGGVFLAFLIVLSGSAASAISKFDPSRLPPGVQMDENVMEIFGNRYDFDAQVNQEIANPAQLQTIRVNGGRGDVTISASADSKISGNIHSTIYAENQDQANRTNSQLGTAKIRQEGPMLIIDLPGSGENDAKLRTRVELQVPRKAALEFSASNGDVEIIGRDGNVKTESGGAVRVSDIKGSVTARMRSRDFTATTVSGDISVEGRADDLNLTDIGGAVVLSGDFFGSIELTKVAKSVRFKSSRSDIEFAKLDGEFRMGDGSLNIRQFTGPIRIDTRSKEITLEDFTGDAKVANSNANVELRPKGQPGSIEVNNRRGDIELIVPEKPGFELNATARRGNIETDFNANVSEDKETSNVSTKIGNGQAKVRLETDNGSISVRKG